MADYFTSDHFKLLNKWRGTVYDKTSPEQQRAYEELSEAFDVTKRWANAVQQKFFPSGWAKTVRKPTDQWHKRFISYNWGRVYPSSESPKELAYTVGMDADLGFVVKIDLVNTQTDDATLHPAYEAIRGNFTASPIVTILSATDGLNKSFAELVEWSGDAIQKFGLSYDEVAARLKLDKSSHVTDGKGADAGASTSLRNWIFYGPPGTGKTYQLLDLLTREYGYKSDASATAGADRRYRFVTFHQSYGYEEFVEGLRPVLDDKAEAGAIRYEVRSGVFKELCERARSAPHQRYVMVIDEINRGNISKIFGELITLIEEDKREDAENATHAILPYSRESFSVPPNVDIIGAMNTADRSLALLDTALRRRFEFKAVMPDARDEPDAPLGGLRVTVGEMVIDVPRMLDAINRRIEVLYDRDHCIGHGYFMPLRESGEDERFAALAQVFRNRILPLLEEYFFEDWQKIRLVLADNQKPRELQFVRESEDDLHRLFGDDDRLESYAPKGRFSLEDRAFSEPGAYIGIYEAASI